MKREDVLRWKENWQVVAAVQRELSRSEGPQPERAIRLSLSMIAAAGVRRPDPGRQAEDERVRQRWARLKARWAR